MTDTNIHCYSGCLTSSKVIITGASDVCPDGSIMRRFIIVVGVFVLLLLVASVAYHYPVPYVSACAQYWCDYAEKSNRACACVWLLWVPSPSIILFLD